MDRSPYSFNERVGAAVAHSSLLVLGLPLTIAFLEIPFSLAPCPVVAYLIARHFRRNRSVWGANQCIQAAIFQVPIVFLSGLVILIPLPDRFDLTLGTVAFLLFVYTLWAALDSLLGYDFRYAFIGNAIRRVSDANFRRQERRSRWSRGPDQ